MRRTAICLLSALLAACQTNGPGVKPAATIRPTAASPTVAPTTQPAASPTPRDVQAALLRPPSAAYQTLKGSVLADPAWLQARAAGTILSNNGSSIAAPNGGSIISDNGAGVLVDGGGGLVAAASGNVIPDDTRGLAARRGGAAVRSADGSLAAAGGIISDNGSGIIANNGGGLTGKVKYALQQAQERPPTAGMLVSAVSLKTHEYLPVGVDAQGQPVFTVYSNLKGEYQLYLPKSEEGNVLVVASAPNTADAHLVYNAVTPVAATEAVPVDEEVAQATLVMRTLFVAHMANVLTGQPDDGTINGLGKGTVVANDALGATLKTFADQVSAHAKVAGIPTGPGAAEIPEVRELAQQMADAGVAFVDTSQLVTSSLYEPEWKGPQEPAIKALGQSFALVRDGAARYLDAHPGARPLQVTFRIDGRIENGSKVPACPYDVTASISQPGDYGAFIVNRLLGGREVHSIINTRLALEAISVPPLGPVDGLAPYSPTNPNWYVDAKTGQQLEVAQRINVCMETSVALIALTLTPPDWKSGDAAPAALKQVLDQIDAYAASHKFSAAPAASALPTCAPEPTTR